MIKEMTKEEKEMAQLENAKAREKFNLNVAVKDAVDIINGITRIKEFKVDQEEIETLKKLLEGSINEFGSIVSEYVIGERKDMESEDLNVKLDGFYNLILSDSVKSFTILEHYMMAKLGPDKYSRKGIPTCYAKEDFQNDWNESISKVVVCK